MTARKRWYQLSMLQMLVAMAVSAAIIPPNVFANRDEGNRKSIGFKVVFIRWAGRSSIALAWNSRMLSMAKMK